METGWAWSERVSWGRWVFKETKDREGGYDDESQFPPLNILSSQCSQMSFLWFSGRSGGGKNTAKNSRKDFRRNDTNLLFETIFELYCAGCFSSMLLCYLQSDYILSRTHEKSKCSMKVNLTFTPVVLSILQTCKRQTVIILFYIWEYTFGWYDKKTKIKPTNFLFSVGKKASKIVCLGYLLPLEFTVFKSRLDCLDLSPSCTTLVSR